MERAANLPMGDIYLIPRSFQKAACTTWVRIQDLQRRIGHDGEHTDHAADGIVDFSRNGVTFIPFGPLLHLVGVLLEPHVCTEKPVDRRLKLLDSCTGINQAVLVEPRHDLHPQERCSHKRDRRTGPQRRET